MSAARFTRLSWLALAICLTAAAYSQKHEDSIGENMSAVDSVKAIDSASAFERIVNPDAALEYVNVLLNYYQVPDSVISPDLRRQFAAAELNAVHDKKKWVSESQLKDAHDTLLRAYEIPEFGLTIQQIHNFRLRQSLLYPKMYSRRQDGSIEEKCRPLEAAYLLFLIDFDFQSAGADPAAQGVPPTLPPPKNFGATHISVSVDVPSEREMKYRRARANFFSSASQKTIDELMLSLLSKLNL